MNDSIAQSLNFLRELPLSKKISMAFILILLISGFAFMFMWANQEDYQVLFKNLSPEDGGAIVSKLRESNIPYKVEANGSTILAPADRVYELRLTLASDGLPNGGNVGFEIFDHTDFRTTKFVQELNYRRALQGELARTINQFREVDSSKVFIVLPKESLFIEDSKPASASIQLNLKSGLPANKLGAIVHLVANAVEGLEPEHVTVVDTRGRVIFKGGNRDDDSALLSDGQLDYKVKVEQEIRKNVQTMLEGIVGAGRAIVRVNASIDFNRITANEEEYDPSTTAVRSKRNIEESTEMGGKGVQRPQTLINKRSGVVPSSAGNQNRKIKKDIATNYEINKIIRTVLKPAGTIKRLSVAAVIDGTYKYEKLKDETIKKTYIPRSEEELKTFEVMVKRAMGFSEDREDQVSVNSLPFSNAMPLNTVSGEGEAFDPLKFVGNYKKAIINLFFIIMAFFFIVKPLMKSLKNVGRDTVTETKELPSAEEYPRIPEPEQMNQREKVLEISKHSPEKTQQFIKGWLNEQE